LNEMDLSRVLHTPETPFFQDEIVINCVYYIYYIYYIYYEGDFRSPLRASPALRCKNTGKSKI